MLQKKRPREEGEDSHARYSLLAQAVEAERVLI